MGEARDIKFCTIVGYIKCVPWSGSRVQLYNKSSSGDEIPERDMTLSSYLFTYLPLNNDTPVVP